MMVRTCTAICFIVALGIAGCGPGEQATQQATRDAQPQTEPADGEAVKVTPFSSPFKEAESAIAGRDEEGLTKAAENLKGQGDEAVKKLVQIAQDASGSKQDRLNALLILGEMKQPSKLILDALDEISEQEEDAALKSTAYEVLAKLRGSIATEAPSSQGTEP